MEWIELLKLLNDSSAQASTQGKLQAQQVALEALTKGINNHADVIEQLHRDQQTSFLLLMGLGAVLVACIALMVVYGCMTERRLKKIEERLLTQSPQNDIINV